MRDVSALAASVATRALHVVATQEVSKSHLGGAPGLPAGVPWPEWQGRRLGFLARISLPDLQQSGRVDWLPSEGALLFFYDVDEQPWGFDPKDKGSCAVLHVADLEHPLACSAMSGIEEYFPQVNVAFQEITVFPSTDRPEVAALELSDDECDAYWELQNSPFQDLPKHQVAGVPSPVQGDHMELECQLASNGLYCGDATGYNDPRAKILEPGAAEWRLLLQLDTDDDAGVMWGDCGTLYFWIRAEEAAAGSFQNPWLVLQCS